MGNKFKNLEEPTLVTMLLGKDPKEFEILYRRFNAALMVIIRRLIKNDALAEDVLQEAFVKIWNNASKYDPDRGTVFTWMMNICRNLSIDKLRSQSYINSSQNQDIENAVYTIDSFHNTSTNTDIIGIAALVDKLPAEQQILIHKVYFEGYTQTETAEELGVPLGTVKTRLRAAMVKLRGLL